MAWRPAYQPQLPQTTWGSFTALHRGHTLRGEALSVQLEARRLRLFDFDVFFFGTAMVFSTLEGREGCLLQSHAERIFIEIETSNRGSLPTE
jgi:hypothetical protein